MNKYFNIFIILVLFQSCKPGIPKEIIQPDQMEKVLYDIHIVDGYSISFPNVDSAKKVTAMLYKGIYNKFGIDSALYNESLAYYYKHPDLSKKMYDRITDQLVKKREQLSQAKLAEDNKSTFSMWEELPFKKNSLPNKPYSLFKPADTVKITKEKDTVKTQKAIIDSLKLKRSTAFKTRLR